MGMTAHTIEFQPLGRRGRCRDDQSIADCVRRLGIGINNICGGAGTCQSCKVRITSGTVSEPTPSEREAFPPQDLDAGWRLACQAHPRSDCAVAVPAESMTTPQRTQVEGLEITAEPDPPVRTYDLRLEAPSLSDQQADADRLLETLSRQHQVHCHRVDIDVLRGLSPNLRSWKWHCQASVRADEVVSVARCNSPQLGLAVDLGTTKIAGYLVDLGTGNTLAARGMMNPQIECGEDVVTRIGHITAAPDGGRGLQALAVGALNQLAEELTSEAGTTPASVLEAVVVGNTALHHFLLGLPVAQLVAAPFMPAVSQSLDVRARDLGLGIAPGAYVHLLPNIAGFVGADHVAMLLATGVWQDEGPLVALDIGTNTEVSLVHKGRITAVSCASGPAFEGGHIRDGMRAAAGAIERLRIVADGTRGGRVQHQTVDDAPPVGICGSGILDAMAQLYLNGIVTREGRMTSDHPLVRGDGREREFVLVSEDRQDGRHGVAITQHDIRELQLAKAAIRTGIQALLESNDCSEEGIRQVVIAGAFGSYIDVGSAMDIGMLPVLPLERFRQVGNAAGAGARLALLSTRQRDHARSLASGVEYLELASSPGFMETFTEATYLGRYRLEHGVRQDIS